MVATDMIFAGSVPEIYDRCLVPLVFDSYAIDSDADFGNFDPLPSRRFRVASRLSAR
jgi:hypothetical protein